MFSQTTMKKLFLTIPAILLLAAACNSQTTTTSQTAPSETTTQQTNSPATGMQTYTHTANAQIQNDFSFSFQYPSSDTVNDSSAMFSASNPPPQGTKTEIDIIGDSISSGVSIQTGLESDLSATFDTPPQGSSVNAFANVNGLSGKEFISGSSILKPAIRLDSGRKDSNGNEIYFYVRARSAQDQSLMESVAKSLILQ
jgi:hypothetical protein